MDVGSLDFSGFALLFKKSRNCFGRFRMTGENYGVEKERIEKEAEN